MLLQADDLGRELADLLLRLVDPGQPLAQVGDDLAGRLLAAVEPVAHDGRQRPFLVAQGFLDALHGVGQHDLPLGVVPAQHQRHQPCAEDDDHRQQDVDHDIHCQPL